jgi:spermidine synthase
MHRVTVLVLFFLSGMAGLIYQVAWVRQSTLVFGVSVYAYSTVLAVFMSGSALGSYILSRRVDQVRSPLRLYALLQVGIALFGLVTPILLAGLPPIYAGIAQSLPPGIAPLTLIRFVLALLALAPATFLMGATLPVMARAFANMRNRVGGDVGQLYAADTLGAALGCGLAGLVWLRLLGTRETIWLAVALNMIAAAGAWWLARKGGEVRKWGDREGRREHRNSHLAGVLTARTLRGSSGRAILWAYALSGFAALGYEVVWARILSIFTLNAVFSFSIMLTTFLLGLTIGGWIAARWVRRRRVTFTTFGNLQLALAITALVTLYIFWFLPNRVTLESVFGHYSITNLIWFEFLLGFCIFFIPATLLGVLFPVAVSLYTQEKPDTVGQQTGRLNAFNTLGAVLGSLATGFVLIPRLGMQTTVIGLSLLNLILGAAMFWLARPLRWRGWIMPAVTTGGFAALALLAPAGYYLGFRSDPTDQMLFYAEGVETTVAVFEVPGQNFKVSFVNGRIEVPTDPVSMRAFRLLGHLPALLRPQAQTALMLSFGNGISTGSLDTHNIPNIDAVDLSAEQFQAATFYWQENYNVLHSAHLHTHIEDGRNFLLQSTHAYDIITTDATHPTNASSWALFTQEFYASIGARLAPDGVFLQWLPFHSLREEDYKTILRTFQSIFPNATLWYTGGSHTLVLATPEPLTRKGLATIFAPAMSNQIVVNDLGPSGMWPRYLAMEADELRVYTGAGPLSTDNIAFFLPYHEDAMQIMQVMQTAVAQD